MPTACSPLIFNNRSEIDMKHDKCGSWPKGRIAILSGYFVFAVAGATESDDGAIEHLTIFGDQQVINDVPGAAYVVSEAELDKYEAPTGFLLFSPKWT